MNKRKYLSQHFLCINAVGVNTLSPEGLNVLGVYTQDGLSEMGVATKLKIPIGRVRQYLNKATLIAKEKEGDPELRKAEQILHGH